MRERLAIGFGALLSAGLFCYLGSPGEIGAIALAVFFHELGHILALRLLGLRIRRVRLEMRGFCIEYYGEAGALSHALAALSGPFAGLGWAVGAALLGKRLDADWLSLSSGVSLLLSVFNLLPALPLDGGRIMLTLSCALAGEQKGERVTEALSLFIGASLLAFGIWLMIGGPGIGVLCAAIWLLLYQENGRGLVNQTEMI